MNIKDMLFKRKFSLCLYKNLKLKLAAAEFSKDITETERANKYPVMFSSGEFSERVQDGEYFFSGGSLCRYIAPLYPSATNEITIISLYGECGFVFKHEGTEVKITLDNSDGLSVKFECGENKEKIALDGEFVSGTRFSVLVRKGYFDVYLNTKNSPEFIHTFFTDEFSSSSYESFFTSTLTGLYFSGGVVCAGAEIYADSGIAQADIRPVCYENGDVIFENGRVFLTTSLRFQQGGCQGVLACVPGTAEFELTGVIFFDAGDGQWENDVASCLVFDRRVQKWLLWMCSFSHGHILGHACFDGEPRFGRNVIDITLVNPLPEGADCTQFGGKSGDEDPALTFDEKRSKWLLAVCRVSPDSHYRYYFFESDNPFDSFVFVGSGVAGSETGGSFLRHNGKIYFICGNGAGEKASYRVYEYGKFDKPEKLRFDLDDGGFRGWGSVFSVKQGSRERIYHLTFDRQNGSEYNWTYGNLYCFEGYDGLSENGFCTAKSDIR